MKNQISISARGFILLLFFAVICPALLFAQIRSTEHRDMVIIGLLSACLGGWLLLHSVLMEYAFVWLLLNGIFSLTVAEK